MNSPRIAALLSIPFFLWLSFYFWSKSKERDLTPQETAFLVFALKGFFVTIYFVFIWIES